MLKGRLDSYSCFHVDMREIPVDFEEMLKRTVEHQRSLSKAMWLEIPKSRLDLVPVCDRIGFYMHHVSSVGLMMAQWLATPPNTLPEFASHYAGAGGLVFKDDGSDEILVIKQKISGAFPVIWKFPGGLINKGETIYEGVKREVREETAIDTQPVGILGFRERNKYLFGMNDIYFVVLMRAINCDIQIDGREVGEAKWMNILDWINIDERGEAKTLVKKLLKDKGHRKPYDALVESLIASHTNHVDIGNYKNTHIMYSRSNEITL